MKIGEVEIPGQNFTSGAGEPKPNFIKFFYLIFLVLLLLLLVYFLLFGFSRTIRHETMFVPWFQYDQSVRFFLSS